MHRERHLTNDGIEIDRRSADLARTRWSSARAAKRKSRNGADGKQTDYEKLGRSTSGRVRLEKKTSTGKNLVLYDSKDSSPMPSSSE